MDDLDRVILFRSDRGDGASFGVLRGQLCRESRSGEPCVGLSCLDHGGLGDKVVVDVVNAAVVVDVEPNPRPGDLFPGMVLLIEDMGAENAVADFIELELRQVGSDFQIAGDLLQGGVSDFARTFFARCGLDVVNAARRLIPPMHFDLGLEALQLGHRVVFLWVWGVRGWDFRNWEG